MEKNTHMKHHWGWHRDRLFFYLNKKGIYQKGIQEEIHPDFRWDPNDPQSADWSKLGKEYYTTEVRRNKSEDKGPRAGWITFKKIVTQEFRDTQRILTCLQKAYNMEVGEEETKIDAPNGALIIRSAAEEELSGYIACIYHNEHTNKITILWSASLGGKLSNAKKFFDAYMLLESIGGIHQGQGPWVPGYGPLKLNTEHYQAELIFLEKLSTWF